MTQNRFLHCVCITQMHLRTGSCTTCLVYGTQANRFISEQILAVRVYYTAYKQTYSFQNRFFCITRYTRKQETPYIHPSFARGRLKPPRLAPRATPLIIFFAVSISLSEAAGPRPINRPWSLWANKRINKLLEDALSLVAACRFV